MKIRKRLLFWRDYAALKRQALSRPEFPFGKFWPCLDDREDNSGTASGHYFHQDLLVAQRIFAASPIKHVDIGSRIDGFVAHVASFREIEVFDVRPLESKSKNIIFKQQDLMSSGFELAEYCDSVSSLHAIEHFGLGRYGDDLDFDGHLKGFKNIHQILKTGGTFYFAVPIGRQRIEFNAHRVFSLGYLLDLFAEKYQIEHFSYVDDDGDLHENVPLHKQEVEENYSCHYGCGIFELTKIS